MKFKYYYSNKISNMEKLHSYQLDVYNECLLKGGGGISLAMGSGKTLISILVALKQTEHDNSKILIVVAKNLISVWENEIKKFFEDEFKYTIFINSNRNKECDFNKYKIIITTPETLVTFYKTYDIENEFIYIDQRPNSLGIPINYNLYIEPKSPFLDMLDPERGDLFYASKWGCLIVDEGHNYFNITSTRSRSICSICTEHRWVLSGTLFDEPKDERILGYLLMINDRKYPRNLPDLQILIRSRKFKGLLETLIYRKNNIMTPTNLKVNQTVVNHRLNTYETAIYLSLKRVLKMLRLSLLEFKRAGDKEQVRKFSSYLLVMIMHTRTFLVCPLITLSSIYLDITDYENKSELTKLLYEEFTKNNLYTWLDNEDSVFSSRLQEINKVLIEHSKDRVVIFTSFRTTVNVITHYIKNRPVFTINPTHSPQKRGEILVDFEKSKNGVLVLTYSLGSDGLNLQCANTVLIADYWWNSGKTKQGVARINRYGQLAPEVHVYYFTSNTGIEKAIFGKHHDKMKIQDELMVGHQISKIKKIKTEDILKIIEYDEYLNDFTSTYLTNK